MLCQQIARNTHNMIPEVEEDVGELFNGAQENYLCITWSEGEQCTDIS